jgi:tetrapyrrole methylase family protein/MazG family protein
MVKPPTELGKFESFVDIVKALRGPEGCPWDKEQTHRTLAPFAIEESFELAEAIESGSTDEMVGELGDVLLQVVLNAEVGRQSGEFTLEDVIRGISEKMVRRHPHVFGDVSLKTSGEVTSNWAKVKALEKAGRPKTAGFDLPRALPALQRSHKIGDKTQKAGFDWPDAHGVFEKVEEEMLELRAEFALVTRGTLPTDDVRKALEHEIGDVLFSVSQLARHLGLDGEQSLRVANNRFESRYFKMRANVEASGRDWESLADSEKESAWQQAKRELK